MNKRLWLFMGVFVIAAAGIGLVFWQHHNHNLATQRQAARTQVKQVGIPTVTTKKPTPATTPTPKTPDGTGGQQSYSTDTSGHAVATTDKSQWVTSESGNLTLQQPTVAMTLTSGSTLSGTAKVTGPVSYRVSDDKVGVLTQGTLSVVNGKFSGTLNFTPTANTGRVDVFTTNSRGLELDEIQIGVKF